MQFIITFDTYIIGLIIIIISVILFIINWVYRDNFYFHVPRGSLRPMEEPTLFHKNEFYINVLLISVFGLFGVYLILL